MKKPSQGVVQLIEKVILGIKVVRTDERRWLRADVIAGVTVFAMLVLQGMAYGELAGVALVVCLYDAALAAVIGYALFGCSRQLTFGPEHIHPTVSAAVQTFLEHKGKFARKSGERD